MTTHTMAMKKQLRRHLVLPRLFRSTMDDWVVKYYRIHYDRVTRWTAMMMTKSPLDREQETMKKGGTAP